VALAVINPVLIVWAASRIFSRPLRALPFLVLVFLSVVVLWQAYHYGPGWDVPLVYGALGIAVLLALRSLGRLMAGVRNRPIDPAPLREIIERLASGAGRVVLVLSVSGSGAIIVMGAGMDRPTVFRLTSGCPLCFVEDRLRALLGEDSDLITVWRDHLANGVNQRITLSRTDTAEPWSWKLRPSPLGAYQERTCPVRGHAS